MNSWERQFYRQLSRGELDDTDFEGREACLTANGAGDRPTVLEAALRLVDSERAYSD